MIKQSGINFGQRRQIGATDTELLIEIRQWLLQTYNINARREWYMGFSEMGSLDFVKESVDRQTAFKYRSRIRCPDLFFTHKEYGMFVIEVDGAIHDVKREKTIERNSQYALAGMKLIVVNLSDLRYYKMSIHDYLIRSLDKWFKPNNNN